MKTKKAQLNKPTACMECGKGIPAGMYFRMVFDEKDRHIGNRCYNKCRILEITIEKKWKEHPDILREQGEPVDWFETTIQECLEHTEGAGYWKPGTVVDMLINRHEVFTPFASYRRKATS